MVWLTISAGTAAPAKRKSSSKKPAATKPAATKSAGAKKGTSTAKKSTVTAATSARKGKAAPKRPATTWRNRQLAPTEDRYREIQQALAAKGYLPAEEATGSWNATSSEAMKKFQTDQNLEGTGKINSLSLIALGLGPKRETPAPPKPAQSPENTH